ncbi:PstS family phosphate ABC transporter substrate-binding protein [Phytobacter sp. V91]|uniref:PstS family phosphate ABC transporter substrate-binding protein n=1 Tax=Phytobacter sp. V91 TaxID=3369425 RepID=UPI003F627F85
MKFWWWVRSLLMTLIAVPLMANGMAFVGFISNDVVVTITLYILCSLLMLAAGWLWAKVMQPQENNALRQSLLLLPAVVVLCAWLVIMQLTGLSFTSQYWFSYYIPLIAPWFFVSFLAVLSAQFWAMVVIPVGAQVCFTLGYYWRNRALPDCRIQLRLRRAIVLIIAILVLLAGWQAKMRADKFATVDSGLSISEELDTYNYRPNSKYSKLTALRGAPPFIFSDKHPRLDGATAAYPVYASAFYALNTFPDNMPRYKRESCCLAISRTPEAYKNIIADKADIIFVAQPSEGQKKRALEANTRLTYTPFSREAFVFITHADNPVNTLTQQQVRDIFSGKITRWDEVGGDKRDIEVWQRPEDSGSQSTMLAKVMKETPMLPPKETEVAAGMGGVLRKVAEYQNSKGAIGYSFRYYATKMNPTAGIKLLAIDGIPPTKETIRDGSYPFTVDVYMVTRENPAPETQKLVAWFLSPQGQSLVEDAGYVPLYDTLE